MRFFLPFLLFLRLSIFAFEVDYDYVFVGTSPISVMEALYRSYTGSRVLLVDSSAKMGGAWKSITICHIDNVDMGCHQIGSDQKMRSFLEEYIGCHFVNMNNPYRRTDALKSSDQGFYFSKGCHEIVDNLFLLVQASTIDLKLDQKLESVYLDFDRSIAEIKVSGVRYTVSKLVITPHSGVEVENLANFSKPTFSKHYHLYLLIHDPTPVRFTYMNGFCSGMSRTINITPFSSDFVLDGSGLQLIAIQTYDQTRCDNPLFFLEELKKSRLIDAEATLVTSGSFIYEQPHFDRGNLTRNPKAAPFFEVLDTSGFWNIAQHVAKWEKAFKPFYTVIPIRNAG